MAQLATCPHCETELLLPSMDNDTTHRGCPNCGESFDPQDLATRAVAEALPIGEEDSPGEKTDFGDIKQSSPAYSGTTLAAFLRDAEQKSHAPAHASDDPSPDELELSRRKTVEDFDRDLSDLTPADPPDMADDGTDFERQWGAEPALRDDLEDSDKFDIPNEEEESAAADDFSSQFGKFTLPDDIPEFAEADGQDSGFGVEFKSLDGDGTLDDDGTLKDFEVPELAEEPVDRGGGADHSLPSRESPHLESQEGFEPSAVPIPARSVARRRRSNGGSTMGTLIKIVLGGIVGVWLAYPIALWISAHLLGRTEEPMALAQYYPNVMLPKAFQHGDAKDRPGNGQQFFAPPPVASQPPEESSERLPPVEPEGPTDRFALPDEPPVAPPAVIVLKDVPKYNLTDLEQATLQGSKLTADLIDGSFAQQELRKIKGAAYAGIANLAHVLSCLDPAVSSHAIADTARGVFPPMFADPSDRAEISEISSHWIKSGKRKHGGILFSGTPDEGVLKGSVREYQFQTPQGNNLTVLVPEQLDPGTYATAVTVGVVGEILYDATVQVEGYTGDAKQAIWGAYLFPISGP